PAEDSTVVLPRTREARAVPPPAGTATPRRVGGVAATPTDLGAVHHGGAAAPVVPPTPREPVDGQP
ncbi:MAG TPA: hypothetical protein VFY17_00220, partial [Pilimelia sp.]|nr:hypothetical protein [Pilimelia sp.]